MPRVITEAGDSATIKYDETAGALYFITTSPNGRQTRRLVEYMPQQAYELVIDAADGVDACSARGVQFTSTNSGLTWYPSGIEALAAAAAKKLKADRGEEVNTGRG